MSNSLLDHSQTGVEAGSLDYYHDTLMSLFLERKYYRPFQISILSKPLRLIHTEAPRQFCTEETFEQCLRQTRTKLKQIENKILEDSELEDKEESVNFVDSSSEDFGFEELPGSLKKFENFQNLKHSNQIVYQKPLRFGWLLNSNDDVIMELSLSESELDDELGWILNQFCNQHNILVLKLENNRFVSAHTGCAKFSERLVGINLSQLSLDRTKLHGCDLSAVFMIKVESVSLRFCCLQDEDIHLFAESLAVNDSLKALNLNFNRINNDGCKYLAHSLRLNRTLNCLSLMHNRIDNIGCQHILEILKEFQLTQDEVLAVRKVKLDRYIATLKEIELGIQQPSGTIKSKVQFEDTAKFSHANVPGVKSSYGSSKQSMMVQSKMFPVKTRSKILAIARNNNGGVTYFWDKNGMVSSEGNFQLSHLNLSHNPLTPSILPEMLALLKYQQGVTSPAGTGLVELSIRNDVIDVDMAGIQLMLTGDSVASQDQAAD